MNFSSRFSCKFLCAVLVALCFGQAGAAEFSIGPRGYGTSIDGEIKKGDFVKFMKFQFTNSDNPRSNYDTVFLNSPGGNVEEALRIGEEFRRNLSSVFIPAGARCFSACTILWAGGVDRFMGRDAKLGFHRLSFARREVDVRRSQEITDSANQKVTTFFQRGGFPALIIEKMNETPPTDIYIIDSRWLIDHELDKVVAVQPSFLDVVEKHCGIDPTVVSYKQNRLISTEEREAYKKWDSCSDGVKDVNRKIMNREFLKEMKEMKEKLKGG